MDSKLKIYLRGLGIGIMVTALILAIANLNRKNNTMTDAEVIARAQELGMVSSNSYSLTDAESDKANTNSQNTVDETGSNSNGASDDGTDNQIADDQNSGNQDDNNQEGTEADNSTSDSLNGTDGSDNTDNAGNTDNADNTSDDTASADDNQNADNTATGTTDNTTATGEEISITVSAGSGSETLAASLLRAGLIDDSKAFNTYMVDNGYATKIRVGTFKIPMGSTYEEICKIVTGIK